MIAAPGCIQNCTSPEPSEHSPETNENLARKARRVICGWRYAKRALSFSPRGVTHILLFAARHFLFLNVPPVHRTPGYSAIPPAAELIHSAVKQYNSQLYWNAVQFQRAHPDASVLFFDAYTTLNQVSLPFYSLFNLMTHILPQIMDQAGENGFKNATRHCLGYHHYFSTPTSFAAECVNPVSEYVWIDHFHLTTAIHFIFAAEVKKVSLFVVPGTMTVSNTVWFSSVP